MTEEKKDITNELHNITMTTEDVTALVVLLNWASGTAAILSRQELINGSVEKATTYQAYATHADALIEYLKKSTEIGEPTDGNVH